MGFVLDSKSQRCSTIAIRTPWLISLVYPRRLNNDCNIMVLSLLLVKIDHQVDVDRITFISESRPLNAWAPCVSGRQLSSPFFVPVNCKNGVPALYISAVLLFASLLIECFLPYQVPNFTTNQHKSGKLFQLKKLAIWNFHSIRNLTNTS